MKTIHQLFNEFKKLQNPLDDDYMKLGHDLATNIVYAPENQQKILWNFVSTNFSKEKNELINFGANFYLKLHEQKEIMEKKLKQSPETIFPKEEDNKISADIDKTEEIQPQLTSNVINPVKEEHKEKMAIKNEEIRENLSKLENNLVLLQEIKDPSFSMKMAIEALEKFRQQLGNQYKPPKI